MSKFSPTHIVAQHLRTLRDESTGSLRIMDFMWLYGLPLAAGAVPARFGFRLQGIGELLAGLAIIGSLLFALVIFVFQLRLQVVGDPRVPSGSTVVRLIDQLFANVTYAVLTGLVATGAAMAAASSRAVNAQGDLAPLGAAWTGATIALTVHLLLVLLMCLKRTQAAYEGLAGLGPVHDEPLTPSTSDGGPAAPALGTGGRTKRHYRVGHQD